MARKNPLPAGGRGCAGAVGLADEWPALRPMAQRNGPALLALARRSFADLTLPERLFFHNLCLVEFGSLPPEAGDEDRTLRADRLAWALLEPCALELLSPQGVVVGGAHIAGELNLDHCRAGLGLRLESCGVEQTISLRFARLSVLNLQGSRCQRVDAAGLEARGGVFLRNGAEFQGEARFLGAQVGGNFECDGSSFAEEDGEALELGGITVKGNLYLRDGASFRGEVCIKGARIGGNLDCRGGSFAKAQGCALNAERLTLGGKAALGRLVQKKSGDCPALDKATSFLGEVCFAGAEIGGDLDCRGGCFSNPAGHALNAERLTLGGKAALGRLVQKKSGDCPALDMAASFLGEVCLAGAEIGGDLDCSGGEFVNPAGRALTADRMKARSKVNLGETARFQGAICLLGAEVGGDLSCRGGRFANTLAAGGQECGSTYEEKEDPSILCADGMVVQGNVDFRRACCTGLVDFPRARVEGYFHCRELDPDSALSLGLSHARVGVLWDEEAVWRQMGKLWLDGFQYGRLVENAQLGVEARLAWLEKNDKTPRMGQELPFNPQPYEQLARVYREAGYEIEARKVLIEKHWRWRKYNRRKSGESSGSAGIEADGLPRPKAVRSSLGGHLLSGLFGVVCGFGYKPWRAAVAWLGLWIVTTAAAWWMHMEKWLVPTGQLAERLGIVAPGYAFDLLTPILSLGYVADWRPAHAEAAAVLMVLSTLGYVLVALFAASITGLVRK